MPLSAEQQREKRAKQRAAEAQDATAARGQRKPAGRQPDGCYWDPRPGEPTGMWRRLDTHEAYDPAVRESARRAACCHAQGARATRVQREPLEDAAIECNSPSRRLSCKQSGKRSASSPPSLPQSALRAKPQAHVAPVPPHGTVIEAKEQLGTDDVSSFNKSQKQRAERARAPTRRPLLVSCTYTAVCGVGVGTPLDAVVLNFCN